jgi:hypothetical protein
LKLHSRFSGVRQLIEKTLTELVDGTQWRCGSRAATRSRRLTARRRLQLISNELNHDAISRNTSSFDWSENSIFLRGNQNCSRNTGITASLACEFAHAEFPVAIFRPVLVRGPAPLTQTMNPFRQLLDRRCSKVWNHRDCKGKQPTQTPQQQGFHKTIVAAFSSL